MTEGIVVGVATHKPYWMPSDPMYLPIQVGAAGAEAELGFQRDDGGEGISERNLRYSELTALYWLWKNSGADAIGLAHYRRQFAGSGERGVLAQAEAESLLSRCPIVVPKRRNYYIETVGSHYAHTFDGSHLDLVRDVLASRDAPAVGHFEALLHRRGAHIFNMFIMTRPYADAYCSWLFPILFDIEERIDYEGMSPFEARVVGRLSERLMDVWLDRYAHGYIECPVISMEKVNWAKKGAGFLAAKFFGKKYEASF